MTKDKDRFIYMCIYNELRDKIENGLLPPGSRLAPENELRTEMGVSRDTMRKALAMLEADGLISRRAALGTFVTQRKANYASGPFHESFTEQMQRLGKQPSSEILSIEILHDVRADIAAALELGERERVYRITRLRNADGEPMAYEIAYVRRKYCPDLQMYLSDNSSLYEIYEDIYKIKMGQVRLSIEAETADADMQRFLKLKGPAALLKMSSLMHLTDGSPFYYVICYHRSDRYVFTTVMSRN